MSFPIIEYTFCIMVFLLSNASLNMFLQGINQPYSVHIVNSLEQLIAVLIIFYFVLTLVPNQ